MSEDLTDEQAINKAVDMLKEKGIFDQIRKNCLEDINTKSSYLNLNQRCEGYVNKYLQDREWDLTLNKNQLREGLRKSIMESDIIRSGVSHLVEQVINPVSFESKIEEQIRELLGIEEEDLYKNEEINNFERLSDDFDDKLSDKLDDISDDEISGNEFEKTESISQSNVRIKSECDDYEFYNSNSNSDPLSKIDTKLEAIRCSSKRDHSNKEYLDRDNDFNYESIKKEYKESITSSISDDDLDMD